MTRTDKELLIILKDNLDKLKSGLCLLVFDLRIKRIITLNEYYNLREFISEHKPKKTDGVYYWEYGLTRPRRYWLTYWINRL